MIDRERERERERKGKDQYVVHHELVQGGAALRRHGHLELVSFVYLVSRLHLTSPI